MSTIRLSLPASSVRAAYNLISFPDHLVTAIKRGLDSALEYGLGQALKKNFSGKGPFPPEQHRLGIGHRRRTATGTYVGGRLRASFQRTPAHEVSPGMIAASVGSEVEYWPIHELGGKINRTVKAGFVRLRTTKQGELVRGVTGGAVFAKRYGKGKAKYYTERAIREHKVGKAYTITMPKRAPMMTGLTNAAPRMSKLLGASIVEMWRTGK